MAFLSLFEIRDIIVMSLVIGWLFKDVFRPQYARKTPEDWLKNVTPKRLPKIDDFWFAVLLVAPSIIFHEFGHKFTAIYYGLEATFHAAYGWMGFAVLMKFIMPGFLFLVPAYVTFPASATALEHLFIAFAGPGINLLFYLLATAYLKFNNPKKETLRFTVLFKRINGFLFIFNMIPIPGFDGYHFFANLFSL